MISQAIRDDLKERFGHRFPEVATLHLAGDDGAPVDVVTVLANPSGAVAEGPTPSGPWSTLLRAALGFGDDNDENLAQSLAQECVLWQAGPAGETSWRSLVSTWPGLPRTIANELRAKIGLRVSPVAGPDGVVFSIRGREIVAKVKRPDPNAWRLTISGLRRQDADHWRIVRELSGACVSSVSVDGVEDHWGSIAGRYPGLAVILFGHLAKLVGASAEVELGEL